MHDPFGWTEPKAPRPMIVGHDGSHPGCGICLFANAFKDGQEPHISGVADDVDLSKEWDHEPPH